MKKIVSKIQYICSIILSKRANKLLQQLKLEKAAATSQIAIRLSPSYLGAQTTLTKILLAQNKANEAIVTATSVLTQGAIHYAEACHTLAKCLFANGQIEFALEKAALAVELIPTYAEAHFTLGSIFYKLNRLHDAINSFQHALSVKPDYIEANFQLGIVFQELGDLTKAEELYRNAISMKPDYANAHNNLGFLLRQTGRADLASNSFKTAHDLFNPQYVIPQLESKIKLAITNAKQYLYVSFDLLRWHVTGGLRKNAWLDYQLLHQATNGVSGDFFSFLLKKLSVNKKNTISWQTSSIFSWVKQQDLPQIIETLNKDGLYKFDKLIPSDFLDEIINYAKSTEACLRPPLAGSTTRGIFDPMHPLAGGYQFNENDMLQQEFFQRLVGDPLIYTISKAYFETEPKLSVLNLWWSTVFSSTPSSDMAQLFHNDLSHIKWLKLFIYLTDVTESTGPHSFVLGSHKPDIEGKELRRRGIVRISDEDIYSSYEKDSIVSLTGPKGTVFIEDTRGFHKGAHPQSDHRLLLEIYIVNSLYPDGKKKWSFIPKHPMLIESIHKHPKFFSGYNIGHHKI